MTRKQKKTLVRIIASAALLGGAFATEKLTGLPPWANLLIYLAPYFAVGYDVLWRMVKNVLRGNVFDENFLMSVATVGAFFTGEYAEAVFVMLFYQVGELFQSVAVGRSRRSIAALMDIRPDSARALRNGEECEVSPDEVAVGETIVVRPGERVPIDGTVVDGMSALDTSALTGESVPRRAAVGDCALSGSINISGAIKIKTEKPFGQSTASKILELVENASERKAKTENFISRFAKFYTPSVVGAAVLLAVIPSIITGEWGEWIHRALIFLVVSCPCALVISVPLAYFAGIGGASARGILIKGSNYIEVLSKTETVIFDKTGTLTEGVFKVTKAVPAGIEEKELLRLAASAERYSTHPIAASLTAMCSETDEPENVTEVSGEGVEAVVSGKRVLCGNLRLLRRHGVYANEADDDGTAVYVAVNERYVGYIVISDKIKSDGPAAVASLYENGVKSVMLSGDKASAVKYAARSLGIDEYYAELLPSDKVEITERIIERERGAVAFVGDGINDAPVIMRADVGIAMGALGSDAAIEAADIVLTDDKPSKVVTAMDISRKTARIVRENIAFSLAVKAAVLIAGALGAAPMALAVFADVGVAVIAILNSMRATKTEKSKSSKETLQVTN